jgi:signal peptidase I
LWREWIRPLVVILAVVGSVRSAVADWNYVPTGSMKPTILDGDRIFVNKLAYDLKVPFTTWRLFVWSHPNRGDVVVLFSPLDGTRYVKRVVGLPGDRIELRDNALIINDEPIAYTNLDWRKLVGTSGMDRAEHRFAGEQLDDVLHAVMLSPEQPAERWFGPVTVPAGHYFVMGDNRDNSFDSRGFGFVPRHRIIGRASQIVTSTDSSRWYRPRWARFWTPIR